MKRLLKKILEFISGDSESIASEDNPPSHPSSYEDPYDGRAVEIPIDSFIDLHTFDPAETENLLDAYLPEAFAKGFSEIRIIHGKGRGVQRTIVHNYLNQNSLIKHFHDAPGDAGGWGATIAYFEIDDR